MSAYCTKGDLYANGLPRGALPNPGRLVADVAEATDVLTLDGHGFTTNDVLVFRAEGSGSLPSPLVAGTTYYAIAASDSTFQVAASVDGAAIDLTTAGSGIVVSTPLPFDAAIAWASAMANDFLPAHVVPLEAPYPPLVVTVAADLAIARLMMITGGRSADYVAEKMAGAQKLLSKWGRNIPLRGDNVPAPAGLSAVATTTARDPRGWLTDGGGIP